MHYKDQFLFIIEKVEAIHSVIKAVISVPREEDLYLTHFQNL